MNIDIDLEMIKDIMELLNKNSEINKYEIGLCINKFGEEKKIVISLSYFKEDASIGKKIYSTSLQVLKESIKKLLTTEEGGENDNQS